MHVIRIWGDFFSPVQAVLGDKKAVQLDFLQQSLSPAGLKNLEAHEEDTLLLSPCVPPNSQAWEDIIDFLDKQGK